MYISTIGMRAARAARIFSNASRSAWDRESLTVRRMTSSLKPLKKSPSILQHTRISTKSGSISSWRSSTLLDNAQPFMNDKRKYLGMLSISELLGNVSFVCATAAYMNTDILELRCLVMGGISLSIVFQYYRAVPLWIPIRWNFLLLYINAAMVTSLVLERRKANQMPKELEELYKNAHFENRRFSRVEFCGMFELGKKTRLKAGDVIARDGQENTKLYFVTEGTVAVRRNNVHIATVMPHHFIGELTFLSYSLDDDEHAGNKVPPLATADAIVEGADGAVVWEWSFSELKEYLKNHREVSNALSAYINYDLRTKLINTGLSMSDLHCAKKDKNANNEKQPEARPSSK